MKSKSRNMLIGAAALAAIIVVVLSLSPVANLLKTQSALYYDANGDGTIGVRPATVPADIYISSGADGTGSGPQTAEPVQLVPPAVAKPNDRPLAANEMCSCGCVLPDGLKLCPLHQAKRDFLRKIWPWSDPSYCENYDDKRVFARTVAMCLRYSDKNPRVGVRERLFCGGYAFRPNSTYFSLEGKFTNCRVVPK